MAAAVNAAYNDTIYGTNPNGSFSIAYNSTRYYAQDRVRKIEAAKKADILRPVKAATKAVVNSATKLAESIKSTSPAVTETAQNEWWKNNSQTYLGPAQMMGGVMGVDIYSYLNSSTYNIVQKILEFRENHPILYTIALAAAIGLIAVIASGPLKVIAAAAFSAGAISMGATAWVIWLKLSVYLVFGETDKIAELADEIPETIRNSFEIGAIAGAIAQALSMIFEWIAEKISTLWGKAKDWLKGTSTPTTPTIENSYVESSNNIAKVLENRPELTGTTREKLLSTVQNDELASFINEVYRPGASIGDGGTADALISEFYEGNSTHLIKAMERLKCINRLISSGNLGFNDLDIAEALRDDLIRAIELFR